MFNLKCKLQSFFRTNGLSSWRQNARLPMPPAATSSKVAVGGGQVLVDGHELREAHGAVAPHGHLLVVREAADELLDAPVRREVRGAWVVARSDDGALHDPSRELPRATEQAGVLAFDPRVQGRGR